MGLPKKRILVIDDEEHIRDSLQFMLDKMGYAVRTEGDSTKVLQILEDEVYDIVLSDVTMPKLDGLELTRQLQERYPDIHVVLISGFRDEEYEDEETDDNPRPDRFLSKPFSMSDLMGCLESL